ncbi:MAG: S1/P1 nuclease [Candidatus Neomarinimicrobiota bacterium]
MRRWIVFIQCIIFLATGNLARGWGNEGHVLINRAAAATIVPGDFGNFIQVFADSLALHAPDPDSWKKGDREEGYRHFIDIDLYSEYPFSDLPATQAELEQRYGREQVRKNGIAPYYIDQYCRRISDLLAAGQWQPALIPLAALGHYVADLHMPLHTVANYNGQLTGNDGIHFRWEIGLLEKYPPTVTAAGAVDSIADPLQECFTIVRESYLVHGRILRADSLARQVLAPADREILKTYNPLPDDTEYYAVLERESGQLAREQLNLASQRVASFWYYCWIAAGRPQPPNR